VTAVDAASGRLAVTLRRLRESRGVTQTDVAKAMRAAGFPWHQQTVERVESVERPVRALEAVALAKLFDQDVAALLSEEATVAPAPSHLTSVSLAMTGLSNEDLLALNSILARLLFERLLGGAS
jgi:transcriptional regulator with XRE-family HTH domain